MEGENREEGYRERRGGRRREGNREGVRREGSREMRVISTKSVCVLKKI